MNKLITVTLTALLALTSTACEKDDTYYLSPAEEGWVTNTCFNEIYDTEGCLNTNLPRAKYRHNLKDAIKHRAANDKMEKFSKDCLDEVNPNVKDFKFDQMHECLAKEGKVLLEAKVWISGKIQNQGYAAIMYAGCIALDPRYNLKHGEEYLFKAEWCGSPEQRELFTDFLSKIYE